MTSVPGEACSWQRRCWSCSVHVLRSRGSVAGVSMRGLPDRGSWFEGRRRRSRRRRVRRGRGSAGARVHVGHGHRRRAGSGAGAGPGAGVSVSAQLAERRGSSRLDGVTLLGRQGHHGAGGTAAVGDRAPVIGAGNGGGGERGVLQRLVPVLWLLLRRLWRCLLRCLLCLLRQLRLQQPSDFDIRIGRRLLVPALVSRRDGGPIGAAARADDVRTERERAAAHRLARRAQHLRHAYLRASTGAGGARDRTRRCRFGRSGCGRNRRAGAGTGASSSGCSGSGGRRRGFRRMLEERIDRFAGFRNRNSSSGCGRTGNSHGGRCCGA